MQLHILFVNFIKGLHLTKGRGLELEILKITQVNPQGFFYEGSYFLKIRCISDKTQFSHTENNPQILKQVEPLFIMTQSTIISSTMYMTYFHIVAMVI